MAQDLSSRQEEADSHSSSSSTAISSTARSAYNPALSSSLSRRAPAISDEKGKGKASSRGKRGSVEPGRDSDSTPRAMLSIIVPESPSPLLSPTAPQASTLPTILTVPASSLSMPVESLASSGGPGMIIRGSGGAGGAREDEAAEVRKGTWFRHLKRFWVWLKSDRVLKNVISGCLLLTLALQSGLLAHKDIVATLVLTIMGLTLAMGLDLIMLGRRRTEVIAYGSKDLDYEAGIRNGWLNRFKIARFPTGLAYGAGIILMLGYLATSILESKEASWHPSSWSLADRRHAREGLTWSSFGLIFTAVLVMFGVRKLNSRWMSGYVKKLKHVQVIRDAAELDELKVNKARSEESRNASELENQQLKSTIFDVEEAQKAKELEKQQRKDSKAAERQQRAEEDRRTLARINTKYKGEVPDIISKLFADRRSLLQIVDSRFMTESDKLLERLESLTGSKLFALAEESVTLSELQKLMVSFRATAKDDESTALVTKLEKCLNSYVESNLFVGKKESVVLGEIVMLMEEIKANVKGVRAGLAPEVFGVCASISLVAMYNACDNLYQGASNIVQLVPLATKMARKLLIEYYTKTTFRLTAVNWLLEQKQKDIGAAQNRLKRVEEKLRQVEATDTVRLKKLIGKIKIAKASKQSLVEEVLKYQEESESLTKLNLEIEKIEEQISAVDVSELRRDQGELVTTVDRELFLENDQPAIAYSFHSWCAAAGNLSDSAAVGSSGAANAQAKGPRLLSSSAATP